MTAISTPDLADDNPEVRALQLQFRSFGQRAGFHGPAVTIKCHEDNSVVKETVNQPGEGRVLVVDGGGSLRCALLGDLLAAAASANGWAGVIIDGAVRDVDEIDAIDIGVKALGSIPLRSTRVGAGQRDLPISIGGVDITPGDYIYADRNGVIVSSAPLIPVQ